jgi:uncharacterized protein YbbK (DUF523 family)/uncharacterized protein YbgA (DUF1722 family)
MSQSPRDDHIRIGISACLLGEEVRFNGGHTRARYLTDTLGQFVDYVSVCPEIEVGMGVPRPAVRLEDRGGGIKMVDPVNGVDWTAAMNTLSKRRAGVVDEEGLDGFILKKDSPSCGVWRVKVYREKGAAPRRGRGLFAEALLERYPFLPVEEEGRLNDPVLRENFVERIFAYRRLRSAFRPRWTLGQIVAFHAREKMMVRAHDEVTYRTLGRLVAEAKKVPRPAFAARYQEQFMAGMEKKATVGKHTNVLMHIQGFFKQADDTARRDLGAAIEDYRMGLIPRIVPLTLIRYLADRHQVTVLVEQSYLNPHPKELMLLNHV